MSPIELNHNESVFLTPKAPYYFDASLHKPSYFPSSDINWEEGSYWISILWQGQKLGLKFENIGTIDRPGIKLAIYSQNALAKDYLENLISEIRWRFNLDSDISRFCQDYRNDNVLGPVIERWRGMKPRAANSLYETLIIYIVLQNATVRRSVKMLENLFGRFGEKVTYDGKTLAIFWELELIANTSEQELRDLKIGYRAKYIMKITEQFANREINEFALRRMSREEVRNKMLKIYGIGPASVEYLLFEYFYFYDALETIPSWERKIISRLLFNRDSVSIEEILAFFCKFQGWEKLAFHYIWEDVFWRREHEHIEWLEKEIRL